MKKILSILTFLLMAVTVVAQQKVTVTWGFSDKDNLKATTITGDTENLLTTNYLSGTNIATAEPMSSGNADTGFDIPVYDPVFMKFGVKTRVTAKSAGHNIAVSVGPATGHTFKPSKISFDAAKCGTDGGNLDVYIKGGAVTTEKALATGVSPMRNKTTTGNLNGYSHHEYTVSDVLVENGNFVLFLYIYNINGTDNENPKQIAFRNVVIEGVLDEPIYDVSHYVTAATCKSATGEELNLFDIAKGLKDNGQATYPTLLYGAPTDFSLTLADGFTYSAEYNNKTVTYTIKDASNETVFTFSILFKVTNRTPKPAAQALKRGLMAVNLSQSGGGGNLVSWRSRKTDDKNYRFVLYRGTNATTQATKLNNGKPIMGKTNYVDASGTSVDYYKLEVYDGNNNLIETEVSTKTWANQTRSIPLADAPVDKVNGATYTPHDIEICDMDGDGEYNFIVKWFPSNAKDAASNGTTSNIYFDCYKADGTFMWRIDMGQNFFASQHTVQFICWDFDGDGYGEFMAKTAPGTKDGEGNWVLLGNDDPNENLKSSRGKQDHGSEYITVFDGLTGGEISTIPYHTDYNAGLSYWGDSKQNKSERYLAAIAWLDGDGKNPSPIFSRGYYDGAFVGAYDFDGANLKERWVSRNTVKGQGLWGEGAHWILVGDCTGNGKQDIVYGSAILKNDGTLLHRTGFGHGDALHMSDFNPANPGKEIFMVLEDKPNWGWSMRDAKTGKSLQHVVTGTDTGRGLAAHFDHEQDCSQFIHSASAAMFNCDDYSELAPTWALGSSGATANYRIYWDGDLADEFCDKSIIGHWNSTGKYFDRYKINGGNYVPGNLNDGTKYHPGLLADVCGDWREEIINWTETNGKYSLVINATSYPTDYMLPHLMDDMDYRAQVIAQNVCYNQPPHLSFDPIVEYTVKRTAVNIGKTAEFAAAHPEVGDYWDCFYTTYPVEIPEGVDAWAVAGRDVNADTLKLTKIAVGKTIPANSGIIYNTKNTTAAFRPSIKTAMTVSNASLKGSYCDSLLTEGVFAYYKFRDGENGLGFYRVNGETVEGGTGFMQLLANGAADFYRLGDSMNPTYVAPLIDVIDSATEVVKAAEPAEYYQMDGRRVETPVAGTTYIVKMTDGSVRKQMFK